jgi:hypothetical protein
MASPAIQHIEGLLRARQLDGTLARLEFVPATAPTGLAEVDRALGGGWRRGELSELAGAASSGRSTLLNATFAAATARGEVIALVDALDRFDPARAAEAGVALERLLWVRGPSLSALPSRAPRRGERALGDEVVRRALRAADLIVRAGGFGVVALDLGDVPAATVARLPMTSWMRLSHANEGRDTVCLLVTPSPTARSPRGVSARLSARPRWTGESAQRRRLDGFDVRLAVTSSRHTGTAEVAL